MIRNWLTEHVRDGRWAEVRRLEHAIHAERLGPGTFKRALQSMEFNQAIEIGKAGRKKVVRIYSEVYPETLGQLSTVDTCEVYPPRARDECLST